MNILFIILKIIGILLLIILILALLVLFHPAFYKIKAEVEEEVAIKGYVWWLFHIVRLEFKIEDSKREVWLRIFGFKKELQSDEPEEDEKESEDVENHQVAKSDNVESVEQSQSVKVEHMEAEEQEPESVSTAEEQVPEQTDAKESNRKNGKAKNRQEDKQAKLSKLKNRYKDFTTFTKVLKKEISDERNHMAVSHIWQEFLYLLNHLKPKYIKGNISFSTGDPATTGEVTGVLSMMPIIYQYDARIYPDFLSEEMYVKGSLSLKGHMALFHVIAILIRGNKDKNIKRLVSTIRRF